MHARTGEVVQFLAGFTASGLAATGLTVTAKVWELRSDGSKVPNDTTGATGTVTEIGGGGYKCVYTMTGNGVPFCVFTTAGTADVKSIQVSALSLSNLDAAVSTRNSTTPPTVVQIRSEMDSNSTKLANLDASVSSRSTYAGSDTPGTTSLLGRIASALTITGGKVDVNDKTGFSGTATNMVAAAPSAASIAAAVETAVISEADGNLVLQAIVNKIAEVNPSLDDLTLGGIASAVRTELTTELGRIDAAISTRLASGAYTAPDNATIAAINAKTTNLPASPAAVSDIPSAATITSSVWANPTRTLSSFGTLIADVATAVWSAATRTLSSAESGGATAQEIWEYATRSLTEKTGFSGTATNMVNQAPTAVQIRQEVDANSTRLANLDVAVSSRNAVTPPTVVQIRQEIDSNSSKMANLDVAVSTRNAVAPPSAASIRSEIDANSTKLDTTVSSRLATAGYTAPPSASSIANAVEAAVINETDGNLVLQAITNKIASVNPSLDDLTLAGIAAAVRTELATELARIDAAISSRLATAGYSAAPTSAVIADAVWDEAFAAHQAAGSFGSRVDTNVGSRLATAGYTAPDNASIGDVLTNTNRIPSLPATEPSVSARPTLTQIETSTVIAKKADSDTLLSRLSATRSGLLDNLTNLDALVSSRLATGAYTAADNASIAEIKAAVDTEVATLVGLLDTEIADIKAKTDTIPVDIATTTDINAIPAAVWMYVDRQLTEMPPVNIDEEALALSVAEAVALAMGDSFGHEVSTHVVEMVMENLSVTGRAQIGRGKGSVEFNDTLTDGSRPVANVSIRAYAKIDNAVVWTALRGMDTTSRTGEYTLFLDPGDYVFVVEKAGREVTTLSKTVA